jgi:hypothetical protein
MYERLIFISLCEVKLKTKWLYLFWGVVAFIHIYPQYSTTIVRDKCCRLLCPFHFFSFIATYQPVVANIGRPLSF